MILDQIVSQKKKEITQAQAAVPLSKLIAQCSALSMQRRSLKTAIARKDKINLIAEIKKASPSKGVLRKDFNPLAIARTYQLSGASALSVLTDKKFFQGELSYLQTVRQAVNLPILRKDFIIDQYQLYQSVCAGADAVLLIARLLSAQQLKQLLKLCSQLKLESVCEVHQQQDLEKVLAADAVIIGINNRNLDTFAEDLEVTAQLIKKIPQEKIVISESAIKTAQDVKYLQELGVSAVLIGETFMRSEDIAAKVKEIMQW